MYLVKQHAEMISKDHLQTIEDRYKRVNNVICRYYWDESNTLHCGYVGSYGRGTAIEASDIDILVELPQDEYERFDEMTGNGQSRLLADVRNVILRTYPTSAVSADGQVVEIPFTDGIKFEILPAFKNPNGTYAYPDTNKGGKWRSTDPFAEQYAMSKKNEESMGLLRDTCKHIRLIKAECFPNDHLSGIVIDSFVCEAIGDWHWVDFSWGEQAQSNGDYEKQLLRRFYELSSPIGLLIKAPGSGDSLKTLDSMTCLEKVLKKMAE